MERITTDAAHLLSERDRGSKRGRGYLQLGELPDCDGEAPDPTYWTAYDLYMIEREARAMRRAYVYSTVAALWKRLRQRIFDTRLAA